ncbi:MAG TPA: hypothetical protein PK022_06570 [Syntrophales bacterium]|nr:hypothetical protein [Syntrophales bacterium]
MPIPTGTTDVTALTPGLLFFDAGEGNSQPGNIRPRIGHQRILIFHGIDDFLIEVKASDNPFICFAWMPMSSEAGTI